MKRNSKITALIAPLALSVGVGIAAPAFAQEDINVRAAAHEALMKRGLSHSTTLQAMGLNRSDAGEVMRIRSELEALMKRGLSYSTALQEVTPNRSDADAVNANAKRHAEFMTRGFDHSSAALASNEAATRK